VVEKFSRLLKTLLMALIVLPLLLSIEALGCGFDSAQGEIYASGKRKGTDAATQAELQLAEEHRWLYELVFSEELRRAQPAETFKSFRVHLKDTFERFPHPQQIKRSELDSAVNYIKGKITYAGIFPKSYKMNVVVKDKKIYFVVRVLLLNASEDDKLVFREKLKAAAELWNSSKLQLDFSYGFRFELTEDPAQAHFSPELLDETRGPYDQYWARNWTPRVVAHEVGHMMGLGDEYQTVSGTFDCFLPSLMCSAWNGAIMPHQHYFVLRRLLRPGRRAVDRQTL
jgi:hypothetical protein